MTPETALQHAENILKAAGHAPLFSAAEILETQHLAAAWAEPETVYISSRATVPGTWGHPAGEVQGRLTETGAWRFYYRGDAVELKAGKLAKAAPLGAAALAEARS